jgi:hypothetical protein
LNTCGVRRRTGNYFLPTFRERLKRPVLSSVRVFIYKEQTKETDEGVGSLFLSGLQNSVVGGNRFINKSIYGKTANPKGMS